MSLFETGFAVDTAAPAADISMSGSSHTRKRKRKAGRQEQGSSGRGGGEAKLQQAEVNLEKLMKRLADAESGQSSSAPWSAQSHGGVHDNLPSASKAKKARSAPVAETNGQGHEKREQTSSQSKGKGRQAQNNATKRTHVSAIRPVSPALPQSHPPAGKKAGISRSALHGAKELKSSAQPETLPGIGKDVASFGDASAGSHHQPKSDSGGQGQGRSAMTALQQSMQKKLGGARFRWINEQLYTSSGEDAHELIRSDPSIFEEYHSGFRSQASSWPVQPIQLFIKGFLASKSRPVIADLGCGDAQLAKTLVPEGFTVLSFDLVSTDGWVVEAQCTKHIPLPGAEGGDGESEGAIVDVVVCCLSLMGQDWVNMISEARRILKSGGRLKIAEVASRFSDTTAFVEVLAAAGFKLLSKDLSSTHFSLFEFARTKQGQTSDELANLAKDVLKPCLYKKR